MISRVDSPIVRMYRFGVTASIIPIEAKSLRFIHGPPRSPQTPLLKILLPVECERLPHSAAPPPQAIQEATMEFSVIH